jgi:hypothetical protein
MSFFNTILEKLGIGSAHADTPAAPGTSATTGVGGTSAAPVSPSPSPSAPTAAPVDVGAKLDALAASHPENANWKTSIVDLLKLLNIDSSLTNRQNLAKELNYTGSTDDSATMNVWLHKAVLTKLSQNGGQVPAELLD